MTRRLLLNRASEPALIRGAIKLLDGEPQILAFQRTLTSADHGVTVITCLFNPTVRAYDWSVEEPLGDVMIASEPFTAGESLSLPSQSWVLFKRQTR